jgi:hypothetical protein
MLQVRGSVQPCFRLMPGRTDNSTNRLEAALLQLLRVLNEERVQCLFSVLWEAADVGTWFLSVFSVCCENSQD